MELKPIVWNALVNDAELKALMGGTVRLENTWAQPDAQFPYAVYRIGGMADGLIMQTDLNVDIFARTDTQQNALDIAQRIVYLLDRKYHDGYRFVFDGLRDVAENERYVWHVNVTFSVRHAQSWRIKDAAGL